MTPTIYNSATALYLALIKLVLMYGNTISPRGKETKELQSVQGGFRMHLPVVALKGRGINYRFMAREAEWILKGQRDLASLKEILPFYDTFSDDGETLSGAYGPMLENQEEYLVKKLLDDPFTRQAVATIWRPREPYNYDEDYPGQEGEQRYWQSDYSTAFASKDIPCSVYVKLEIRPDWQYRRQYETFYGSFDPAKNQVLNLYLRMRSSDLYLGAPYDFFTFALYGAYIAARVNRGRLEKGLRPLRTGNVFYSADSCHIYREIENGKGEKVDVFEELLGIIHAPSEGYGGEIPEPLILQGNFSPILSGLKRVGKGETPAQHEYNLLPTWT